MFQDQAPDMNEALNPLFSLSEELWLCLRRRLAFWYSRVGYRIIYLRLELPRTKDVRGAI